MQSVHYCVFYKQDIFQCMLAVHVKNNTCKYNEIDRCGDHMYAMR